VAFEIHIKLDVELHLEAKNIIESYTHPISPIYLYDQGDDFNAARQANWLRPRNSTTIVTNKQARNKQKARKVPANSNFATFADLRHSNECLDRNLFFLHHRPRKEISRGSFRSCHHNLELRSRSLKLVAFNCISRAF